MSKVKGKTALANVLDRISELDTIQGGDVISNAKVIKEHKEPDKNTKTLNELDDICEIAPELIKNWAFADRPASELGDIQNLANEFLTLGQLQPCIVRPLSTQSSPYKYELIVGERRWRAATLAKIKLKVIVKTLDDQAAALYQAAENLSRKELSDYAKGMSYALLIEENILSQKALENKLNISTAQVTRLLSFKHIPDSIICAIADMSKITARTAAEIRSLAKKGDKYIEALVKIAPQLANASIGASKIKQKIETLLETSPREKLTNEVRNSTGRHLFTWRKDSNGNISISFPKDIRNQINRNHFEKSLLEIIENQLGAKES